VKRGGGWFDFVMTLMNDRLAHGKEQVTRDDIFSYDAGMGTGKALLLWRGTMLPMVFSSFTFWCVAGPESFVSAA
jgi:hypothetical protein